jgi:hypothetical protein
MKTMSQSAIYWSEIVAAGVGLLFLAWILAPFLESKKPDKGAASSFQTKRATNRFGCGIGGGNKRTG